MEVFLRDTIVFSQVSFGLIPEVLNAVDMILCLRKFLGVINSVMFEVRDIQGVVA